MKRRSIFAAIIACAAAVSMTACGGGGSAAPATTAAAAATTAAAAAAAPAAEAPAAAEVTLGIGYTTAANDNDPYHKTATIFKQIVEDKTGGRIVVNQYPSSQLGSEPEMWEGMQTGTCDMAVMTNAYVSSYVPANGSLDLPFIFPDLETARKVLDGEYGQKLIDNMKDLAVYMRHAANKLQKVIPVRYSRGFLPDHLDAVDKTGIAAVATYNVPSDEDSNETRIIYKPLYYPGARIVYAVQNRDMSILSSTDTYGV